MTTSNGTVCVHGANLRGTTSGPLVPPLVQSTTYAWTDLDHAPEITYARGGNAVTQRLEHKLALLEGGDGAVCFGSGLAAIDALLRTVPERGRVVAGRNVYGGTSRLLTRIHGARLRVEAVDSADPTRVQEALEEPADLVLLETPSNPTLAICDLRSTARAAHDVGALLAVDNTFLTPLYQRPLELGADIVVHSTTKYIDGHNATLGGALVVRPEEASTTASAEGPLEARFRWIRKSTGAALAPFEAWLTLQGLKTLHLRTRQQWRSATALADALRGDSRVQRVLYPGLNTHPGHVVHRSQATGDGGILSLDLGSLDAARRFSSALRVFTLAENLGATESLATHPASMTHADLPPERRRVDGITDGLVRLSVGVEETDDLVDDVARALDAATPLGREAWA